MNIQNITIIYSHGNAEDLGIAYNFFCALSEELKVNIVGYDYTGYGPKAGTEKPSEHAAYKNIEAVYDYVTKTKGVPEENVIL